MSAMPITKSAKKALRNSQTKRERNVSQKETLKRAVKKVKKLVADKKHDEAKKYFPEVQKLIDKAAKNNLFKKNTAARKKSRIVAMMKKANV